MTSWRPLRRAARKQETRRSRFWPEATTATSCRGCSPRQLDELLLDVGLAAQPVRAARRAQRRALDEQPVDAAQALVGEQVLEAEAGAAVGAQVAGVEQALAVGLDEQRARVGRGVVDGDGGHASAAEAQRLAASGKRRRSGGQRGVGEEDAPHLEDRDRAVAAVDRDGRVRVVGEAVVVEVRVREDDRRDVGRRRVVGKTPGMSTQDALGDQLLGRPLRRAAREVAAVRRCERHAEVEEDARAVVGGDLDAHAADLVAAAADDVASSDRSLARMRVERG